MRSVLHTDDCLFPVIFSIYRRSVCVHDVLCKLILLLDQRSIKCSSMKLVCLIEPQRTRLFILTKYPDPHHEHGSSTEAFLCISCDFGRIHFCTTSLDWHAWSQTFFLHCCRSTALVAFCAEGNIQVAFDIKNEGHAAPFQNINTRAFNKMQKNPEILQCLLSSLLAVSSMTNSRRLCELWMIGSFFQLNWSAA